MRSVTIRRFTPDEAISVASWSYPPPFDVYDGDPTHAADYLLAGDHGDGFHALVIDGEVVGFCCFGAEARVPGQREEPGVVDVGIGIRPDLVSSGVATSLLDALVDFAVATVDATSLRAAVASFNERSLRLCRRAGFVSERRFEGPGREFQELVRPL